MPMLNLNRANLRSNRSTPRSIPRSSVSPRRRQNGRASNTWARRSLGTNACAASSLIGGAGPNSRLKTARDSNADIISKSACASILLRPVSSLHRPQRVPSLRSGARCADMPTALSFTAPICWAPM